MAGLAQTRIKIVMSMDYSLLQPHTVELYKLQEHDCSIKRVNARSLLVVQRFDLFAKLFYIDNIKANPVEANRVYAEHIKAFNPDGREPGRSDKNGVGDFISTFDEIIEHFKENDFDERISVVPVDKNGVILDGAHRVAALAYYDREVTIAQFEDVEAVCTFDYSYFKNRGLAWSVCDTIALELVKWVDNVYAACIWPSNTQNCQQIAVSRLSQQYQIAYIKDIQCNLNSLSNFVGYIYRAQDWTRNPLSVRDKASRVYGKSGLKVAFFKAGSDLDAVLKEKEEIRQSLGKGKDSLHITDNGTETLDIAGVVLTTDGMNQWLDGRNLSLYHKLCSQLEERWFIFKNVQWIAFKVAIYRIVNRLFKKHVVL